MSPVKYVSFDVWIQTIINIKGCSYKKNFELFAIASTAIYCDQWQNDNLPWYSEELQVPLILHIIHSSKFFCRISILVAAHDNLVNHPRKLKMLLKTYSEKKDGQKS